MKTVSMNEKDWFEVQKLLTKRFNKLSECRYDREEPTYGEAPAWLQRAINQIANA